MGNIETKNGIPLYEQVYSALCRDIDLGIYKSGEQIPAEGYLCEKFHVSRVMESVHLSAVRLWRVLWHRTVLHAPASR